MSFVQQSPYDVAIVGARCAGAFLATLLARAGLSVVVLDKAPAGTDTLSTHALMRGGVIQLARHGLLEAVVAAGTPAVRETTFVYGDETVTVPMKPQAGTDALYAPRRTVLDPILQDAARDAGARLLFGHLVTGVTRAPSGRVDGLVARGPAGEAVRIAADLVVGADGVRSRLARDVGARTLRTSAAATATVFAYLPGVTGPGYRWHFAPGAAAGLIPTNDAALLLATTSAARFQGELGGDPARAFPALLAELSPDYGALVAAAGMQGKLRAFGGIAGHLRQSFGPGWALVGDAGFFRDPLTAHGITDALVHADLLAEAILGGGGPAPMRRFQEARDALALPILAATEAIAGFVWDLDEIQAHHAALNRAMKAENAVLAARAPLPTPAPLRMSA